MIRQWDKSGKLFRQSAAEKIANRRPPNWTMAKAVPAGGGNPWAETGSLWHLAQMTTSQSL
jgi:hypothetical protein